MKTIPNFPSYSITEDGTVYKDGTQVAQMLNGGYMCVNLKSAENKRSLEKVHRLVAATYLARPEKSKFVYHIDGDKMNNHYTNLRWSISGVVDEASHFKSTLNGKVYKSSELEEMASRHNLPVYTIRNRLIDGWEEYDMQRGYRDCDVVEVDGILLATTHWSWNTGIYKLSDYLTLVARDNRNKEQEVRRAEHRHERFLSEIKQSRVVPKQVHQVYNSIIRRCEDPSAKSYSHYGGSGVYVDNAWDSSYAFYLWWVDNYVAGWEIDKDIGSCMAGGEVFYGPSTCNYIPRRLNLFISTLRYPGITQTDDKTWEVNIQDKAGRFGHKTYKLTGNSELDVFEQWLLYKYQKLEFILDAYPKTPQKVRDYLLRGGLECLLKYPK